MGKQLQVYVVKNDKWSNVTNLNAVIYGAGQGLFDMLYATQLPNIFGVVDSNENKQKKHVIIRSKDYSIESPKILDTLESGSFYIVISSIKYQNEIINNIKRILSYEPIIAVWNTDIRYCYECIYDMFLLDPFVNRKILQFSLVQSSYEIIDYFERIVEDLGISKTIDRYISINKGGSKLVFLFGNENQLWVFSYNGLVNSNEMRMYERIDTCLERNRKEIIDINKLDSGVIVYDRENILVQNYAKEIVDFESLHIKKEIMRKCRELHSIKAPNLNVINIQDMFYWDYRNNVGQIEPCYETAWAKLDVIGLYDSSIISEANQKSLIHADLTFENIMLYDSRIIFIDWEYLAIGEPMFDICYYIFSIHFYKYTIDSETFEEMCESCYDELPEFLRLYYETESVDESYKKRAFAVMDFCIMRVIMQKYSYSVSESYAILLIFLKVKKTQIDYGEVW